MSVSADLFTAASGTTGAGSIPQYATGHAAEISCPITSASGTDSRGEPLLQDWKAQWQSLIPDNHVAGVQATNAATEQLSTTLTERDGARSSLLHQTGEAALEKVQEPTGDPHCVNIVARKKQGTPLPQGETTLPGPIPDLASTDVGIAHVPCGTAQNATHGRTEKAEDTESDPASRPGRTAETAASSLALLALSVSMPQILPHPAEPSTGSKTFAGLALTGLAGSHAVVAADSTPIAQVPAAMRMNAGSKNSGTVPAMTFPELLQNRDQATCAVEMSQKSGAPFTPFHDPDSKGITNQSDLNAYGTSHAKESEVHFAGGAAVAGFAQARQPASMAVPIQSVDNVRGENRELVMQTPYGLAQNRGADAERAPSIASTLVTEPSGRSAAIEDSDWASRNAIKHKESPPEDGSGTGLHNQQATLGIHATPIGAIEHTEQGERTTVLSSGTDGNVSLMTSSGKAFHVLDAGPTRPAETVNHFRAGRAQAEVGYMDPVLGWTEVRGSASGGSIHATVLSQSPDAAQVLSAPMAGLHEYLADHHIAVNSLTLASPGESAGSSMRQHFGQPAQQGSEQHSRQDDATASSSGGRATRATVSGAPSESETVLRAPLRMDAVLVLRGGHISVMA